jgi:sortase (surface protein transpeptidase)
VTVGGVGTATHDRPVGKGRRLWTVIAIVLAVIGALLITLAVRGSRSGAPQPSASAGGVIAGESAASGPAPAGGGAAAQPSGGAAADLGPVAQASTAASSTEGSSSRAPVTASSPSSRQPEASKPRPTSASPRAAPTKAAKVVVPSFRSLAKGLIMPASPPVSMAIPAIKVTSALVQLGLNPDGTVEVPSLEDPDSKAGWYRSSPAPGSLGPAIILGHIDSKKYGPGVFYELGNLKPGQEVTVTRRDGSVAVFKIDGVRSYPKDHFPTATVYGNIDHAGLRLITCGGTFDPNKGSYESNIVVYASLASAQ